MIKDILLSVESNKLIAKNTFKMILSGDIPLVKAGQFIQVQLDDKSLILRRPFGISDCYDNKLEIIYEVKGKGTVSLSCVKPQSQLKCLLPLGNGFDILDSHKKIVLLGGGLGSVVLPMVVRAFPDKEFYTYLGFRNKENVICSELQDKSKKFVLSTDDGSNGLKGFAINFLKQDLDEINPDIILACGSEPMYKSMQKSFVDIKPSVQISLESRMGCGFGACLVCACKIKAKDGVKILRVCKDGPVFLLDEVLF